MVFNATLMWSLFTYHVEAYKNIYIAEINYILSKTSVKANLSTMFFFVFMLFLKRVVFYVFIVDLQIPNLSTSLVCSDSLIAPKIRLAILNVPQIML